jgi:hypothetical protein
MVCRYWQAVVWSGDSSERPRRAASYSPALDTFLRDGRQEDTAGELLKVSGR